MDDVLVSKEQTHMQAWTSLWPLLFRTQAVHEIGKGAVDKKHKQKIAI